MSLISLLAPLAGWALPLEEVPDPVFSERMMGDGIAIDPLEGILRAPCDAEVISLAETGHSISLRLANGAELLIHIGLETVALKGAGFDPVARSGQKVAAGDELIRFDMEAVARGAESLVTPIVIASEGFEVRPVASNRLVAAGEPLAELRALAAPDRCPVEASAIVRLTTTIRNAHGLHARPAARIVAVLKPFQAEVSLGCGERQANARSTVALLTLGAKQGDDVVISGAGGDAEEAVTAVCTLIDSGMGDEPSPAPPASRQAAPAEQTGSKVTGVCAAPGFARGTVVQLRSAELDVPEAGYGSAFEKAALERALGVIAVELGHAPSGAAEDIGAAHRALLEDPELLRAARDEIDRGKSAAYSWRAAIRSQADALRGTGDARLIERIDDLVDLERRVIGRILAHDASAVPELPDAAVIVADLLLPSQFLALPAERISGIVTARGGPTSHVAILAASAGIPMLVAAGPRILSIPDGRPVILDAESGSLNTDPTEEEIDAAEIRVGSVRSAGAASLQAAASDCVMADGTRIEVFANVGSLEDAAAAVRMGAEGCGLLRTEFLFLERSEPPSEEEQRSIYRDIALALGGRPLIVRTLDIGGDKPVPYLPFAPEDNPALGQRGVRLSLARPDLLSTQLRAILSGIPSAQCRIMLPMIVDVHELREIRSLYDAAARAVRVTERIPLGIMIETPAAAMLADTLAAEADFLSVGTNDLSQYTLAMDRGNEALADKVDALHPSVLRLIARAGEGAKLHGRWLGVCGGLASNPNAAALLIGLGVTELSAVPSAIPAVKAAVRARTLEQCRALAARVLAAATAAEVRAIVEGEA